MPYLLPTIEHHGVAPTFVGGLGQAITIPNYTIWSSGDISSFWNVILDRVSALETDISHNVDTSSADGSQLHTDFENFKSDFLSAWSQYHDSWPAISSSTPVTTAQQMAGRFNALLTRYTTLTGEAPTPGAIATVQQQATPSPQVAGLPIWAWAGLGVAGLGLIGWIFMSVRGTASELRRAAVAGALASNRRHRRRRRRA